MNVLFYVAAAVAVISTLMVIIQLYPVHALLYLIVSLLSIAVIFFLLGAPFAAALEVIICAGAIMVLLGKEVSRPPGWRMTLPIVVLAVLSIIGGLVNIPRPLGGMPGLSDFLKGSLPPTVLAPNRAGWESALAVFSGAVSLGGILLIVLLLRKRPRFTAHLAGSGPGEALHRLWFSGWGFDRLYDLLLVHPYVQLARINRGDVIDLIYRGIGLLNELAWRGLIITQDGRIRSCALGVALGAAIVVGLAVFL